MGERVLVPQGDQISPKMVKITYFLIFCKLSFYMILLWILFQMILKTINYHCMKYEIKICIPLGAPGGLIICVFQRKLNYFTIIFWSLQMIFAVYFLTKLFVKWKVPVVPLLERPWLLRRLNPSNIPKIICLKSCFNLMTKKFRYNTIVIQ